MQPVVRSSNQLVFLSPSVSHSMSSGNGRVTSRRFPVVCNISFTMDSVASVRRTFAVFRVLANPRLTPFKDGRKKYRGEILTLEVSYVLLLCE